MINTTIPCFINAANNFQNISGLFLRTRILKAFCEGDDELYKALLYGRKLLIYFTECPNSLEISSVVNPELLLILLL